MKRPTSSDEIRETFLRYFTERGHQRIAAASVIPVNDPTLLFVNAGMAPMKRYFLGEAVPPSPDLCNIQPCVRTIDIGDVGDRHHLTFFEMLGSWSIGHYFKDRAVELAFGLLTEGFGFTPDELYVTVHRGSDELGLPPDDISAAAWERAGIAPDHIVYLGDEDNFWSAGDTGPCGPCTEVFYDTGPEHGPQYRPGGEFDSTSRYIEIWNAGVFMEFNRLAGGTLERLRFASVDTGSGLERMAMVLQGRDSVYETDLFAPIVTAVETALNGPAPGSTASGSTASGSTASGCAAPDTTAPGTAAPGTAAPGTAAPDTTAASQRDVRLIADHVRASVLILGEGVAPSNEGRGYIPRRLLRTAIATATQAGAHSFDLREVALAAIGQLERGYPQLSEHRDQILAALDREQRDFGRVVRRGLDRLAALAASPGFEISGEDVFALFATHGMPVDLIRDFAASRGGSLDERRFAELFAEHRELSRPAARTGSGAAPEAVLTVDPELIAAAGAGPTSFLGYQQLTAAAKVLALAGTREHAGPYGLAGQLTAGERGLAVFDQTPFYAEGGGQIGDTGQLTAPGTTARVLDTQNADGRFVHLVEVTEGVLQPGDTVELAVDSGRRQSVMRNHSATHLLHAALRQVLGEHVRQAGSLVAPDRLRFDFDHPQALTPEQADEVERLVNAEVLANARRTTQVRPFQEAVGSGAIAFFGDKYGDDVRVISFGDFSAELCGGTHVQATAEVGLFRIVSEGSIGSGVRRIEAVTGAAAVTYTLERDKLLKGLAARLRVSVDQLPQRVESLAARSSRPRQAPVPSAALAPAVRTDPSGQRYVIAENPAGEPGGLPAQARQLSAELDAVAVVLLPDAESGSLRIGVSVPRSAAGHLDARTLLQQILAATGGRGGGSAQFAQGGGISPADGPAVTAQVTAALGLD
jgi:alanyl-tRNA synthetase